MKLEEINAALGYAESFITDWIEHEGINDPDCHKACETLDRVTIAVRRWPDLIAALRTARVVLRELYMADQALVEEYQDPGICVALDEVNTALKGIEE